MHGWALPLLCKSNRRIAGTDPTIGGSGAADWSGANRNLRSGIAGSVAGRRTRLQRCRIGVNTGHTARSARELPALPVRDVVPPRNGSVRAGVGAGSPRASGRGTLPGETDGNGFWGRAHLVRSRAPGTQRG